MNLRGQQQSIDRKHFIEQAIGNACMHAVANNVLVQQYKQAEYRAVLVQPFSTTGFGREL